MNVERIIRRVADINKIDEQIANLGIQRKSLVSEIEGMTRNGTITRKTPTLKAHKRRMKRTRDPNTRGNILAYLDQGEASATKISEHLGKKVSAILCSMLAEGKVRKTRRGVYALPLQTIAEASAPVPNWEEGAPR